MIPGLEKAMIDFNMKTSRNTKSRKRNPERKQTGLAANEGFFGPESMIRRVDSEAVVLLGGGRAILLQLAHPFIAAGVDDYSNFEEDILNRLYNTILFMHTLVFENRHRGRHALKHFHTMHERIRGRLGHRSGNFPENMSYSGRDPEAKLWVHATFVDTSLLTYETFLGPLTHQERQEYYSDSLEMARLLEIPENILPPTMEDFRNYMNDMLTGDSLAVTDTARYLANAVLYPDVGFLPGLSATLLRFVTGGLLPDRFRGEFGLAWGPNQRRLLNSFRASIRFFRPVVPGWIWRTPLQGGKLTYLLLWGVRKSQKR